MRSYLLNHSRRDSTGDSHGAHFIFPAFDFVSFVKSGAGKRRNAERHFTSEHVIAQLETYSFSRRMPTSMRN